MVIFYNIILIFILPLSLSSINNTEDSTICNSRGIYIKSTKTCQCIENFISLPSLNNQCNYQKKSKTTAVILSIFAGYLGADQFYLGNTFKGFLKVLIPISTFIILSYLKLSKSKTNFIPNLFFIIPFIVYLTITLIDFALIVTGSKRDSFGFELV